MKKLIFENAHYWLHESEFSFAHQGRAVLELMFKNKILIALQKTTREHHEFAIKYEGSRKSFIGFYLSKYESNQRIIAHGSGLLDLDPKSVLHKFENILNGRLPALTKKMITKMAFLKKLEGKFISCEKHLAYDENFIDRLISVKYGLNGATIIADFEDREEELWGIQMWRVKEYNPLKTDIDKFRKTSDYILDELFDEFEDFRLEKGSEEEIIDYISTFKRQNESKLITNKGSNKMKEIVLVRNGKTTLGKYSYRRSSGEIELELELFPILTPGAYIILKDYYKETTEFSGNLYLEKTDSFLGTVRANKKDLKLFLKNLPFQPRLSVYVR